MKKPNLFIIGAPKCGTTSMIHYIGQHPEVFVSPVKEPHFFNTDSKHRYFFDENSYLNLFKEATNQKYLAEGSVWYMYSKKAVENILKFNVEAKFIVMLRNPVDMYFSLHQELLFGGTEDVSSPLKAWNLQAKRLKGENIPLNCSDESFLQYKESCSLGKQVEVLLSKVKKDNVKFITLDEVKADSDSTYLQILDFLSVEIKSLPIYEIVNEKKVRKSHLMVSLLKYIQYMKNLVGLKKGFGIANKINKLNIIKGAEIPAKREVEKLKLQLSNIFKKDLLLLEELTGKNLTS
jgi:hypothetical protein